MTKIVTIAGNLAADPELRFTNGEGKAVANMRVLCNERFFNRDTEQWENGETVGFNVEVWEQAAENLAESLTRGMAVFVHGEMKVNTWTGDDGETKSWHYIKAHHFGPDLKHATTTVTKNPKTTNHGAQPTTGPGDEPPF
ncbi:single-stranded DNA-binding protein [Nocardioides pacificus]